MSPWKLAFSELFPLTFVIGASCHLAFGTLGLIVAVLSPGNFRMGLVPATSPMQAIGVLLAMLVFALVINVVVSAVGSAAFVGVRTFRVRNRR